LLPARNCNPVAYLYREEMLHDLHYIIISIQKFLQEKAVEVKGNACLQEEPDEHGQGKWEGKGKHYIVNKPSRLNK
jgi:hypothetical protein